MKNLIFIISLNVVIFEFGFVNSIRHAAKAKKGEYPWFVSLKAEENDMDICAGSLISSLFVLSAGFCFRKDPLYVYCYFGSNRKWEGHVMKSYKYYVNPVYPSQGMNRDIALIKLPEPIQFTDYIKPISLPLKALNNRFMIGKGGFFNGIADKHGSKYLRYAKMDIVKNHKCLEIKCKSVHKCDKMCGRSEDGRICDGDIGGGFYAKYKQKRYLIGVAINGIAIGGCNAKYTIMQSVIMNMRWIMSVIGPSCKPNCIPK